MKSNYRSKIIGALCLCGGICFLGEQLQIWDVSIFFPGWWTILIILPALFHMLDSGIRFGNVLLLAFGGYFLLEANDWISLRLSFGALCAIVCILIGVRMIIGPKERCTQKFDESNHTSNMHCSVVFGTRRSRGKGVINSVDAQCLMGSQVIDLSEADIRNMEYLSLRCTMGTIDLIVPEEMNYVVKSDNIVGACTIADEPVGKYDVYVDVSCILGQVTMRKRTHEDVKEGKFKEK